MPIKQRMRRCLKEGIRMKTPDRIAPQIREYVLQKDGQRSLQISNG